MLKGIGEVIYVDSDKIEIKYDRTDYDQRLVSFDSEM